VVDVAGGHQPLSNEDGTIWAVLNGEIYNHPSLQDRLKMRGHRFASHSDTEVIVHGYEQFGPDVVHAVEGMFAFAIWDRHGRKLVLARDRFGEKPLFYTIRSGHLTFASELTALRDGAGVPADLCANAVDAFFLFGYVPGPGTIVHGIQQVPPGHVLTWDYDSRSVQLRRYWAPLPMPSRAAAPFGQLVEETHQLLSESVRSRMIADVPLGVFLSGGVDSSLVTAMAARHSTASVKTFSVGYDLGGVSELEPARRIAQELGTDHHEIILTSDEVRRRAPAVLAALDQPIADQALIAAHALADGARRVVTVAVGGEGADELFGGYPRYRWLERSIQIHRQVPESLLTGARTVLNGLPLPGRARHLRELLIAGSSIDRHIEWVTEHRQSLRRRLYGSRLQPTVTAQPSGLDLMTPAVPGLDGEVAGIMQLDQTSWLPDDVLAKADRASMLVSLEVRTPFLMRELAEFAATVPAAIHYDGSGKSLLRAVLKCVVPTVPSRAKTAFRVPSAEWLRGPLSGVIEEQLHDSRLYSDGWFDRVAVQRMASEHHSWTRDWSWVLWPLMTLGLWMDANR
jgi:asparagine synthase (glutamine-hydrolysing)